ncbi:hypothetical protein M413DRAFT_31373 [Hebeloma cylindrosporum]|uniref:Uncharacterized protein n=1 Tax=Hebeloma cylindrosporum TaxID=76867 RepID=A0A0C3BJ51_HEBCY|nr:hypothetical protein M413DRAFT_31373 [Hebeloma cylindrosporum h7]
MNSRFQVGKDAAVGAEATRIVGASSSSLESLAHISLTGRAQASARRQMAKLDPSRWQDDGDERSSAGDIDKRVHDLFDSSLRLLPRASVGGDTDNRREGRHQTTAETLTWPDGLKSEEATDSPERAYDGDIDNKRVRSIRATPINVAPPSGQGSGSIGRTQTLAGRVLVQLLRGDERDGLKSEEAADSPKRAYAGDIDNKRVHHLLDSSLRLLAPSSGQGPGKIIGASSSMESVAHISVTGRTKTLARRKRDTGGNSLKFITRSPSYPPTNTRKRTNDGGTLAEVFCRNLMKSEGEETYWDEHSLTPSRHRRRASRRPTRTNLGGS